MYIKKGTDSVFVVAHPNEYNLDTDIPDNYKCIYNLTMHSYGIVKLKTKVTRLKIKNPMKLELFD